MKVATSPGRLHWRTENKLNADIHFNLSHQHLFAQMFVDVCVWHRFCLSLFNSSHDYFCNFFLFFFQFEPRLSMKLQQ